MVLPDDGLTESAVTTAPPGTVQVPRLCHPLFTPPPSAFRNTVLLPPNAALKLNDTVSDRLLPDPTAEEPLPFKTHWRFCSVAPDPAEIGPSQAVPASLVKIRLLAD